MSALQEAEEKVAALTEEDLAHFRDWFAEFDNAIWDKQIERDSLAGKMDDMIVRARQEHAEGKTRRI